LGAANAAGGIVTLLGAMALLRVSLNVFHRNNIAAYGVELAAGAGLIFFLLTHSVSHSLLVFLTGALIVFWTWTAVSFVFDRKAWVRTERRDSYEGYLGYLNRPERSFHRSRAIEGLRTTFSAQLLFFSSLARARSDSPASRLPASLGTRILASEGLHKASLSLRIEQDLSDLHAIFKTEEDRREEVRRNLQGLKDWVAAHEASQDPQSAGPSLDDAKAQVRVYEQLVASFADLVGAGEVLSPASLARLQGRLVDILKGAFGLIFPPEFLAISVWAPDRESSPEAPDFTLKIRATIGDWKPARWQIGTKLLVYFDVIYFNQRWSVEFSGNGHEEKTEFEITTPSEDGEHHLGMQGTYSYLILRAYANFAWQMFREMGLVEAASFADHVTKGPEPLTFASLAQSIRGQLRGDLGKVTEEEWKGALLEGAQGFAQHYEGGLREIAREVETSLAGQVQALFDQELRSLESGLSLDLSLDIGDGGLGT
jgi:hypothetical protein